MPIEFREVEGAVLIPLKVVPGASRTALRGEWAGRLKVSVTSPPSGGKANRELEAFLAKQLGIPRNRVSVVEGQTSPVKLLRADNVGLDQVVRAFGQLF